MTRREVQGVVWLPSDFARRALLGRRFADRRYSSTASTPTTRASSRATSSRSWADWLAAEARTAGRPSPLPIAVEPRVRFNPAVKQPRLSGAGPDRDDHDADRRAAHRAGDRARVGARHDGSADGDAGDDPGDPARQAHPLFPARHGRHGGVGGDRRVPFRGAAARLAGGAHRRHPPCSCSPRWGWGCSISSFARNQFVAAQIAIIATFLPAFILSGFVFDINSMPRAVQIITHIVAARYFVAILQSTFLAGDVWSVILPNAAALIVDGGDLPRRGARRSRANGWIDGACGGRFSL